MMKEEGESSGEAPNGTAGATPSGASQAGSSSNSSASKGSSSSSGMPLLKQEPVEAASTPSSSSSHDGSAADGTSGGYSSLCKTEHSSPADPQGGGKAASGTSGSAAATKEEEQKSREGAAGVNGTADSTSRPGSSGNSPAHVKEDSHSSEAAAAGSGAANSSSSSSSGSTGGTSATTGSSGTTSSGGLTVNIDGDDVKRKLARLFSYWNAHYNPPEGGEAAAAGGGESWQGVDALVVLIGRSSGEEEEGKNEQMQMWLTGFQFPETLFVFTRTGEWLVLSSAKKLEHLHQIEHCREGISLHARNNADGSAAGLAAVQAAINRAAAAAGKTEDEAIVGRLQPTGPAQQQGSFAQRVEEVLLSKYAQSGRLRYVEEGLVMAMAVHTPAEVESIRGASVVAVAMLKTQVVSRIETVLDNEQQESHAAIAGLAENLLKDAKQLDKLREKYHIDPGEIYLLYSNVQSGKHFDLRASAQPTEENLSQGEGTILVSLGVKYKELCAAVARTYLLNGTQEQKDTYQFTVDVFQKVLSLLQPGTAFASIYTETRKFIEEKRPALADHFVKMCGHCVGLDYRHNALVLNARNTKAVVERGMTFNISVGFSQLQTSGNHPYAVWIADTVHIPTDEGGPPYVVLTDMLSKVLRHVSYELEDAEEDEAEKETAAAAEEKKPKKQEEKEEPKKSSSSVKEKQQEKSSSKKTADARGKEKTKKTTSAAATGGGGAISATILNNAESVILRDRLRRRTGAQAAMQQQEAEERDARQRQLRKKKLEQLRLRFDNEGGGAGLERKKKEGKKMEDIRCFRSPDEFPRDLKANKLYVDFKSESLLVPIHGSHIPFHLSTVKNVTCSEAERQSDAAAAGGGGGGGLAGSNSSRRTQFFVLRVNFQVPGSQTLTLKGEENPLPDLSGRPETVFVKELMFKSEDGRHLQTIYRTIKEQLKRVKQKALEDDNAGEVAEQDKLVLNRTGRRVLLKDLMIRPNIAPGMRKLIGSLEAHTNGLRFTVNTRGQMDQVDITYSNIKHAIFQPCERELIVLIHFHLKSAIMVGKKRTQDVQFYTEAGTQTDDLDNRRNRSYHDPDETQDEIRERELKRRLNSEFKRFVTQVEDIAKIEFDLPYRELRFTGVPMKSNVEILPTANCLVHLIEWPPFVLPLEDIELVSFERVAHGLRNFDVVFVFQDYTKPVKRIDLVPIEFLDNLKRWLNELEIVWYEGKQNLNWNAILKQIREDLQGFVEAGGFDMFLGEDGRSGDEGDSEDDDDDEEYEESESESEYNEGSGEEEEDSGKDSSDASSDSDDESLADESDEDEEYNDVSSDEEEGLSWDELEERAKKEDRKRRAEDSDEEEDRRKKKKKK